VVFLGIPAQLWSAANITDGSTLAVASQLKLRRMTTDSVVACNFHTRALCHVRGLLTDDVTQTVTSHVKHRPFQAGLLQCAVEWRADGNF